MLKWDQNQISRETLCRKKTVSMNSENKREQQNKRKQTSTQPKQQQQSLRRQGRVIDV